jgi:YD repeat-containing protein
MDGYGRAIANASDHAGSTGGFSGQQVLYDRLGHAIKTSNPTETSASGTPTQWAAAGDDASAGWLYTQQTYDWKGWPLVTTNTDGTTKEASYAGCGCAGGAVLTMTDEGTLDGGVATRRQQKAYADVLGRTVKTEALNWAGGSVYSTSVSTYNARDQVTQVRQFAGADTSGTYQDRTMTYDGYGRLKTKHAPQQQVDASNSSSTDHTNWDYNADDSVQKITDARSAYQAFTYNARGLVTGVSYGSTASGIQSAPSATFAYDASGNRSSMTDGLGSATYTYDQLSRMTAESRTLTGVGTFGLSYTYNVANELSSVTDPFGAVVGYSHDTTGRLSAVTGSNFAGVSSYASSMQYRAWGALKSLSYGNSLTLALTYDSSLKPITYEVPGLLKKSYQYFDDGRIKFTLDQMLTSSKYDRSYSYDNIGRLLQR